MMDSNFDFRYRVFRYKRFSYFKSLINNLPRPLKILDVGGTDIFWKKMNFKEKGVKVSLLNLVKFPNINENFKSIVGDARNMSHFKDQEFDVVFSNSAIEHLGSLEDQRAIAKEIRRVGKYYFVQSPNRFFFIEPHFLIPFFNLLPEIVRIWLIVNINFGRYRHIKNRVQAKKIINQIRLLNKKELCLLFPHSFIKEEKFSGMTKSFMVHNFKTY